MSIPYYATEPMYHPISKDWTACILLLENGKYGLMMNYKPKHKHIARSSVVKDKFISPAEAKSYAKWWVERNGTMFNKQ